jgi:hypothetical protein
MRELTPEEKLIGEIAEQNNPYDKQLSSRHLFTEGFKAGYRYAINVCDFADAVFKSPEQAIVIKQLIKGVEEKTGEKVVSVSGHFKKRDGKK